jgi:hypothetical protein
MVAGKGNSQDSVEPTKKLQTVTSSGNVSLNMMSTGKQSSITMSSSNGATEFIKFAEETK